MSYVMHMEARDGTLGVRVDWLVNTNSASVSDLMTNKYIGEIPMFLDPDSRPSEVKAYLESENLTTLITALRGIGLV